MSLNTHVWGRAPFNNLLIPFQFPLNRSFGYCQLLLSQRLSSRMRDIRSHNEGHNVTCRGTARNRNEDTALPIEGHSVTILINARQSPVSSPLVGFMRDTMYHIQGQPVTRVTHCPSFRGIWTAKPWSYPLIATYEGHNVTILESGLKTGYPLSFKDGYQGQSVTNLMTSWLP